VFDILFIPELTLWFLSLPPPPLVRLGAVVRVASYSAISPASHQYNDIIFLSITIYNLTERRDRVVRKQSHNTPMEAQGGSNVYSSYSFLISARD
jgi:hypothetical protein